MKGVEHRRHESEASSGTQVKFLILICVLRMSLSSIPKKLVAAAIGGYLIRPERVQTRQGQSG